VTDRACCGQRHQLRRNGGDFGHTARLFFTILLLICCNAHVPAAQTHSHLSYEDARPTMESVDLAIYQRIRDEGLLHSHVMEYASALSDDIGPRLTGSANMLKANEWSRDQLSSLGCSNAHLEDWGEFGTGWQQLNTWVRMTSPDTGVFIAQAVPWSPPTHGPITADVAYVDIQKDEDFEKYRGKLARKIVLLGAARAVAPVDKPLFHRYSDQDLADLTAYPTENPDDRDTPAELRAYVQRYHLRESIAQFLFEEKAAAVIRTSRDQRDSGGSGGTIVDDFAMGLSHEPYIADRNVKFPMVVVAIENYGRVVRLLQEHVSVTIEMDVETKVTGDHEHGYNTIADIPGTDPVLKNQIVMIGAHLDSWASGTGATDNGAGSAAVLEVARILTALDIHPRRTIRFALWSGEEEGIFGSRGYVRQHLADVTLSKSPEQLALPDYLREISALHLKPEHELLSVYFNVDYGPGRIRGAYLEGNAGVKPIFAQWIVPLKDIGVTTLSMRGIGSTDHRSFDAVGIPAFQFIQDQLDYESRAHHSNMDTYERLVPGDLEQIATVEAIFAYDAAMRDHMLPRKPVPSLELRKKLDAPLPNLFPDATSSPERQ
jgi:carboxypeptidase Q